MLVNESSNRLNELAAFPLIYPNAGKVNNDGYYANEVLDDVGAAVVGCAEPDDEPAADLRLGRPHRRGAAEPALSRAG